MTYRLIPLDDAIVFPTVTATLPIDVGDEERVFLIPRNDGEFGRVGVVAEVIEHGLSRRGNPVATVVGLHRGLAGAAQADENVGDALRVEVQEIRDGHPDDEHTRELSREYRAVVEEILELRGDDGRITAFLRSIDEPGALADTSGLSPDISNDGKLRLLETIDVTARLRSPSSCSVSAWPSFRSAARSATTSSPAPRNSSATTSCANRWSRSAKSWARTRPA